MNSKETSREAGRLCAQAACASAKMREQISTGNEISRLTSDFGGALRLWNRAVEALASEGSACENPTVAAGIAAFHRAGENYDRDWFRTGFYEGWK